MVETAALQPITIFCEATCYYNIRKNAQVLDGLRYIGETTLDTLSMPRPKTSEIPATDAKIVIVAKSAEVQDLEVDQDDIFLIDPESTIATADALSQEQWETYKNTPHFVHLFNIVFGGSIILSREPRIQGAGSGVRHVVGMLILLSHAENLGKRPLLRYPETCLHQKIQARLADLFIELSKKPICNFKTDEELVATAQRAAGITPTVPNEFTPGQKVRYIGPLANHLSERGIIKCPTIPGEQEEGYWVVYHCDGHWDSYEDYTSAWTDPKDLIAGWED